MQSTQHVAVASWPLLSKQARKKGSSFCFDLSIVYDGFALKQSLGLSQSPQKGKRETRLKHRTIVSWIKGTNERKKN